MIMYLLSNSNLTEEFLPSENCNISQNAAAGCSICGKNHDTEKCPTFENFQHVQDSKIPPRAILTLPEHLKVELLADGSKTVFAVNDILKGTQFGPYEARRLYSMNPFDIFPIKVFNNSEHIPEYYLDTSDENQCNWMCYVAPAYNVEEQNLICYQLNVDIYFSAIRDIKAGEQLKVWYAPYYATKLDAKLLDKPLSAAVLSADTEQIQQITEKLPADRLGAEVKQNWCCKMCGQIETNVVIFAKHLLNHYTHVTKNSYVCDICGEGFNCEKRRAKHKKYKHLVTNAKSREPKKEDVSLNKPDLSKSDLIGSCMPLPIENLMSDALTESDQLDNSNLLMLDQLNLTNSGLYTDLNDVDTLRAILYDNTKASKTAQENSIADFSLELVENNDVTKTPLQPPFTCDICNKQFGTLAYIRRHLKKHTGEFTCLHCLVAFARKENYLNHFCTRSDENSKRYACSFCPKLFSEKKYLKRHTARHLEKCSCKNCGKHYSNLMEKIQHSCLPPEDDQKKSYKCDTCNRTFRREFNFKKHMKSHNMNKEVLPSSDAKMNAVCEICAEEFKSVAYLKQHRLTHSEPKYECSICSKKFFRLNLYSDHLLSHGPPQFPCKICGKKLKTKKNLNMHMLTHTNDKRHQCSECGKKFSQRTNMIKHRKTHIQDVCIKCLQCNMNFDNRSGLRNHKNTVHPCQALYTCSMCEKSFEKNYQLKKHAALQHSSKVFLCHYCLQVFKHKNSIKRHLHRVHPDRKDEWNNPATLNTFAVDRNLAFENLKTSEALASTEVLSLQETEQQITLGKNAYILDDGTIVQPQDEGSVTYYVLDEQLRQNCT